MATEPPIRADIPDRVWRIRPWVRVAGVAAGVGCVVLVALLVDEAPTTRADASTWPLIVLVAALAVVLPVLVLRPRVSLRSDGRLSLRGVVSSREESTGDIRSVRLTPSGLTFEFASSAPFTSIVFQPTRHLRYPRYFEVIEALTGAWPSARSPSIEPAGAGRQQLERLEATPQESRDALRTLLDGLALPSEMATVEWIAVNEHIPALVIRPAVGEGETIHVIAEQCLVFVVATDGRWEFSYDDESEARALEMARAVIAGDGFRTTAFGRGAVTVTLASGERDTSSSYDGCLPLLLPLPGWRRWGMRKAFAPYGSGSDDPR